MSMMRQKRKKGIASLILAILPILSIYKLSVVPVNISLGDMSTAAIAVATLVEAFIQRNSRHRLSFKRCRFTSYFIFYLFLSMMLLAARQASSIPEFVNHWLRLGAMIVVLDLSSQYWFDRSKILKYSVLCAVAVALILIVQVVLDSALGIGIFPYVQSRLLTFNGNATAHDLIQVQQHWRALGVHRWSAVFTEPAHFAQYVCLPLCILLFGRGDLFRDKKRLFCTAVVTLAVFLSRSANGVFLGAMVWALFIASKMRRRLSAQKFALIILAAIAAVVFVCRTDFIQTAWARVQTTNARAGASTGNQRLLQGFAIYEQLPAWAKIIGIGYGNLEGFLLENNVRTAFLSDVGNEYMNGFSTVLVSGGIVGLIWYLAIWLRMFFEYRSPMSRAAWLVITVLMCTSAMFYSPTLLMYLIFIKKGNSSFERKGNRVENAILV